jgi:hypothetical protein
MNLQDRHGGAFASARVTPTMMLCWEGAALTEIEHRTEVVEQSADTSSPAVPAQPAAPAASTTATDTSSRRSYVGRTTRISPSGAEVARRVVVLVFGLIQILIGLRVLLLLLNAREANTLVRFILDLSQVFVGPFEGILRTHALQSSGSVLDLDAIVAFVGWTVLELIVIWIINVFRREPA